jgi:hypothetical protein
LGERLDQVPPAGEDFYPGADSTGLRLRGATSQLIAALRKLQNYPEQYGGLQVALLREEMGDWLLALSDPESHTCPPFPEIRTLPPGQQSDAGETIPIS